jgi:hypothetical protein
MNIFKIKIGSKNTSKFVIFTIIEKYPEKAIDIAINLAMKEFSKFDSLCVLDIFLVKKIDNKNYKLLN